MKETGIADTQFTPDSPTSQNPPVKRYHAPNRMTGRASDILQTARDLFEEHGVVHVSICQIAKTMGCTRELIYYYFDGKQALIDAVIDV